MVASHIVKSYDDDLRFLNARLFVMGDLVRAQLRSCFEALERRDRVLAEKIIDTDPQIDELEHEIDTFAIRMIALRQPVASDLRQVVAALKISNHLERVGDYSVNIARRVLSLMDDPVMPDVSSVDQMLHMTSIMIQDVLKAYEQKDVTAGTAVWLRDRDVDALYMTYLQFLLTSMRENGNHVSSCTHLLFISKNIERAGDHAANIAEIIHYMVYGTIFKEPVFYPDRL